MRQLIRKLGTTPAREPTQSTVSVGVMGTWKAAGFCRLEWESFGTEQKIRAKEMLAKGTVSNSFNSKKAQFSAYPQHVQQKETLILATIFYVLQIHS